MAHWIDAHLALLTIVAPPLLWVICVIIQALEDR